MPAAPGPGLYLYDVTSSYLEGACNELAAFGYNRDGKKGKRQIVIGLLCNGGGRPLSIEVFAGNTQDPATLASQINKVAKRFGGGVRRHEAQRCGGERAGSWAGDTKTGKELVNVSELP